MTDYFDFEDRIENDDTYERYENRPNWSLSEAIDYDYTFLNKILNKAVLEPSDKYNIASIAGSYMWLFQDHVATTKSFEEFTIEVMGKEWFNNMTSKWLARKSRELAKHFGMPEMADNRNIIMFKPGEE